MKSRIVPTPIEAGGIRIALGTGLLLDVLLFLISLHAVYPAFRAIITFPLAGMVGGVLWLAIAYQARPDFFLRLHLHRYLWIFLVLYTAFIPRLFDNSVIGNRYLVFGLFPFYYLAYEFNLATRRRDRNWLIVRALIPFVLLTSMLTVVRLHADPWASRVINTTAQDSNAMMRSGIGGYDFIYMLLFLSILMTGVLGQRVANTQWTRLRSLGWMGMLVLFVYTLLLSNFFTALGVYLIACVIMFFSSRIKLHNKIGAIIIVMLLLGSLVAVFADDITPFLGDGRNAQRIAWLLSGGNLGTLTSERNNVMSTSLQGFNRNFLDGLVYSKMNNSGGYFDGFGQHSQFLDTFALFGGLIGLLQVFCLLHPLWVRFTKGGTLKFMHLAMLCSTILMFTYDNGTPSIGFAVYFVYPAICDYLKHEDDSDLPSPSSKGTLAV